MTLSQLDIRTLRALAGDRWFARGEAYLQQGRVSVLTEHEGTLAATVRGTRNYEVSLRVDEDGLQFSCSCPLGDDEQFCKHCVAVALACMYSSEVGKAKRQTSDKTDLRAFLDRHEKEWLIELLLHEASENPRLDERLRLQAARENPAGVDLAAYRRAIAKATRTGGFVDYRSAGRYARGVDQVIDSISALLDDGYAHEVVQLAEYALTKLEKAIGEIDDSDGNIGDLLGAVQDLHYRACQRSGEDQVVLARRLFDWEIKSGWDVFSGACETYANILGEKGLAEYRRLAESKWAQVAPLAPGKEDPERYGSRFRITHMMEALARQAGDPEALVAVKSRDLSHPYSFLQIAEIYRAAGKNDQALAWAERGVKAFTKTDSRLSDFLAEEYERRGRHAEAMHLIWLQFAESPHLENYKKLQTHALRTKQTSDWTDWREKALAHLRAALEKEKREWSKKYWNWAGSGDHSPLVKIFLWERRIEDAWDEACAGGCSQSLWLQLAAALEKDQPEKALPIYKELIAPTIAQGNNDAYEEAIAHLRKVVQLMVHLGRATEVDDYLTAVRVEYKRKRNFIKLLDAMTKQLTV
ncbi:MAG TPA: SWIM zinc finger family protein [Pyrinomonadaceae bacterium]|nr:SWIM zinc finger family protein [Pyrinomonadaceae bacterium]